MEMLAFALVIAARLLHMYFQPHTIKVLTETPLKKVLQKPNAFEHLVSWSIELSEFNINYLSGHSTKCQALTDFIAEFSNFLGEVSTTLVRKPDKSSLWLILPHWQGEKEST